MKPSLRNYYNYFTEIEEHFVRKRGRNLLVSPLDWCLIDLWKSSGVPLHIALRGIDRSFENAKKRSRKSPTTLFYCHPAVMESFEEFSEAKVGDGSTEDSAPSSPLSKVDLLGHLQSLKQKIEGRGQEAFQRAERELKSLTGEVEARERLDLEEIDATLTRLADMIADKLFDDLSPEESKQLRSCIRADLKIYRKRLSADVCAQLERNYRNRLIRQRFGVPEFSLFQIAEQVS